MTVGFTPLVATSQVSKKTFIGYCPCLTEPHGLISDSLPQNYLVQFEAEQGNIRAMGWYKFAGEVCPIIFIRNAKDVTQHLSSWINGDTSWFKFVWEVTKTDHYSVALIPDLGRTLQNSEVVATDVNLFQWVWCFNSQKPNQQARKYLKSSGKQKILFADIKHINNPVIAKVFLFPVVRASQITDKTLLAYAKNPSGDE